MLAIFKTIFILAACYAVFVFIIKKAAQKSTYISKKTLPFTNKGLKNDEIAFLLDDDFPSLDLPQGVYVLPPHAQDPTNGRKREKILAT